MSVYYLQTNWYNVSPSTRCSPLIQIINRSYCTCTGYPVADPLTTLVIIPSVKSTSDPSSASTPWDLTDTEPPLTTTSIPGSSFHPLTLNSVPRTSTSTSPIWTIKG